MIKAYYACTIFLSSFLLFLVQPMIAKVILPWFGGTSTVWITCVLFFQLALLGGYLYAHALISRVSPVRQLLIHASLLIASVFFLPVIPSSSWKLPSSITPSLYIMGLLVATVGLPYFLLSTTSPLLQAWFARRYSKALPYRFFALSNLASLLGLLSYPFLIETTLTLRGQSTIWSIAYGVFALLCATICFFSIRNSHSDAPPEIIDAPSMIEPQSAPQSEQVPPPGTKDKVLWLLLSACSSLLLLSTTDHLSQNIAAIPLLWILPLSLYLLSFTLCFDRDRWYSPKWYFWIVFITLVGMSYGIGKWGVGSDIRIVIFAYCIGLFFCCMFCHGELARRKPAPRYLTSFYLLISIGGALGSIFVVFIAPNIFSFYFELPIGLILCACLLLAVNFRKWWVTDVVCAALIVRLLIIAFVHMQFYSNPEGIRMLVRNFYGHQRVIEYDVGLENEHRDLIHGTITHGIQFTAPEKRSWPTAYFGPKSGIGIALQRLPIGPRRVGIVGLGAGTMAAYARQGDHYTYYEINPQVEEIARKEFSFLSDSPGMVEIKIGDGRLLLEQEWNQQFDLLAVDAFSGDSIPIHLLTIEAIKLYFSHLKPDGILAFHVSNLYLDLPQVIDKAGKTLGKHTLVVVNQEDETRKIYQAEWVLMASNPAVLDTPEIKKTGTKVMPKTGFKLWTDDYSNLLQAFH
jgi:hypothetical protein